MKKYLFGLGAIVLAIAFSAFTKPTKPFADYIFKYVGPATQTQSEVQNRNNWNLKIVSPFTECTASVDEDLPCSFETAPNTSYRTSIGSDLYKPSTTIQIVGKLSDLGGSKYVVDKVELVSNGDDIHTDLDNTDQP